MRYFLTLLFTVTIGAAPAAEPGAKPVKVGLYLQLDNGYYQGHHRNLKSILTPEKGFECRVIMAEEIRAGGLKGLNLIIMPGGSGRKQADMLEASGREKIREFVKAGGGYIGICAGAYLATNDYPWSLGLLNAKVVDKKHWARGKGEVSVKITGEGKETLASKRQLEKIMYMQGPLLAPGDDKELPAYAPLAEYVTEIAENGAPKGVMKGTTAIASAPFGEGRVICYSPHPELPQGPNPLVLQGALWAAGRENPVSRR